jgi:hypothetical protein
MKPLRCMAYAGCIVGGPDCFMPPDRPASTNTGGVGRGHQPLGDNLLG